MRQRTILEVAFRLQYDIRNLLATQLHDLNIGIGQMQMRALRAIWRIDNATSQDIVSTLKRDKAQVTRLVHELCEKGLVVRVPNPDDKRSKLLQLTDAGSHIFKQIEAIEKAAIAEMAKDIAPEDLQTFFDVADQLAENMRLME